MESILDENDVVCLNDGRATRIDVARGHQSAVDLTKVSQVVIITPSDV